MSPSDWCVYCFFWEKFSLTARADHPFDPHKTTSNFHIYEVSQLWPFFFLGQTIATWETAWQQRRNFEKYQIFCTMKSWQFWSCRSPHKLAKLVVLHILDFIFVPLVQSFKTSAWIKRLNKTTSDCLHVLSFNFMKRSRRVIMILIFMIKISVLFSFHLQLGRWTFVM